VDSGVGIPFFVPHIAMSLLFSSPPLIKLLMTAYYEWTPSMKTYRKLLWIALTPWFTDGTYLKGENGTFAFGHLSPRG